jgi:RNA polymerase sigma-70 factor, ECF subfamily
LTAARLSQGPFRWAAATTRSRRAATHQQTHEAAAGGDGQDFARAYDEHVWQVYGFLAYRLGRREDAEDLTQLTFERALKAWHRYDARKAKVSTWLLTIARNLLIDHHRADRSSGDAPIEDHEDALFHSGADPSERLGLDPAIELALRGLADREREVIALRFGGDMTGAEISEAMGLTLANVQQILSRSLRKIRTDLESAALREAGLASQRD